MGGKKHINNNQGRVSAMSPHWHLKFEWQGETIETGFPMLCAVRCEKLCQKYLLNLGWAITITFTYLANNFSKVNMIQN